MRVAAVCWIGLIVGSARAQDIVRVMAGTPAGDDGLTWATAFDDLQAALNAAAALASGGGSVEIWVAAGTYVPSVPFRPAWFTAPAATIGPWAGPRTVTFRLLPRIALYGGFSGTESTRSERDWEANPTILSGDLAGNDGPGFANYAENAYHVVACSGESVDSTARLDGFRIVGGHADLPITDINTASFGVGGGMHCADNASPIIANCTFIANRNGAPTGGGAAIFNSSGARPLVINCRFLGNHSINAGGAVWNHVGCGAVYVNCFFSGNFATDGGAAVDLELCSPENGCTVVRSSTYVHCTFTENTASRYFACIVNGGQPGGGLRFENCIFWNNSSGLHGNDWISDVVIAGFGPAGTPIVNRCLLQGSEGVPVSGVGNFRADPLLAAPRGPDNQSGTLDDDPRLSPISPCIDAGSYLSLPMDLADLDGDGNFGEPLPLDLLGAARAIENPAVLDRGVPGPDGEPIPDLGAVEHTTFQQFALWSGPDTGGSLGAASHWSGIEPTGADWCVFPASESSRAVTSAQQISLARLVISGADVTLSLPAPDPGLSLFESPSLLIDGSALRPAALRVRDGALASAGAAIGRDFGGEHAMLDIDGPSAAMHSSGPIIVGHARLRLANGASLSAPAAAGLRLRRGGVLGGSATIAAGVTSGGRVDPGESLTGTLTINGSYTQLPPDPLSPASGAGELHIQAAGAGPGEFDRLVVNGPATLGGGLFVSLVEGYLPEPGDVLSVLTAGSVLRPFDVAFLPALPENRFLRVSYGLRGPGGTGVTLSSVPLPTDIAFGAPTDFSLSVGPVVATTGDFVRGPDDPTGAFPDLAVAVSASPSQPGFVVILPNRGTPGGMWLGFESAQTIQLTVGIDPSGIVAANLDGVTGDEIVVANRGDDTLSVLRQTSPGVFTALPPVAVGGSPVSLALLNLDRSSTTRSDLAVGCAMPGEVRFLLNNDATGAGFAFSPPAGSNPAFVDLSGEVVQVSGFNPDRDKDTDLVITMRGQSGAQGSVRVLVNTAPPAGTSFAFVPGPTMPIGSDPTGLVVGDLNMDGGPDIAVTDRSDATVKILINTNGADPGGTVNGVSFAPAVPVPIGEVPRAIVLADLDLDAGGDLDIAVLDSASPGGTPFVRVLRNDLNQGSQLAFAETDARSAGTGSVGLLVADVDRDGSPDLITLNRTGLRGPGNGVRITRGTGPNCVQCNCPADYNGLNGITVQDLYDFLFDWSRAVAGQSPLIGNPDFNRLDEVTVQDIYDFLAAWTYGCD